MACVSLRSFGSDGASMLGMVPVKVPASRSTAMVDMIGLSDVGRMGVLK